MLRKTTLCTTLVAIACVLPVTAVAALQVPQPAPPTPAPSADEVGGIKFGQKINKGPVVPGKKAKLINGKGGKKIAAAPAEAPDKVKEAIWAANRIIGKPYIYGGGHQIAKFTKKGEVKLEKGYDCSGTVSFPLISAKIMGKTPLHSTLFMTWGERGEGEWITVFSNSGHAFARIAGLDLDTSGYAASDNGRGNGPHWWNRTDKEKRQRDKGYKVRHPKGL